MSRHLLILAVVSFLAEASLAFQTTSYFLANSRVTTATSAKRTRVIVHSTNEKEGKKKKNKPFDEGLRTKLVSESIAPWRNLRLFLYFSLGSGAAVGGFITLAGTIAAISGARNDLDLNTQVR